MGLRRGYVELHIAVILLAFTAILGDLISLPASALVWWRTLIAVIGMAIFLFVTGRLRVDWIIKNKKLYWLGGMIAIHWICFFGSIKLANASTALICFATISFFTALIEPLITKRKFVQHEIIFGLLVIPGIILIAGPSEGKVLYGVVLGLLAALLISIVASLQKKWLPETDAEHMTLMQMAGAWIAMCVWLAGEWLIYGSIEMIPSVLDMIYLLILGIVCTCVGWVLSTRAMKTLTAFDSMMVINLEPVYGIGLALLVLHDAQELNTSFYIGAMIIFASVFIHPLWQSRYARS